MFNPRPKQRDILAYQGGKMGVSAVPGSGKTQILSQLAAQIIASGTLEDDQDVLIVTLVNAAVDNFAIRVGERVKEHGLLPNLGYRVRTLHGLAHDIVRERPDLLGLSEDFQIIDERDSSQIRQEAALAWLKTNPDNLSDYLDQALDVSKLDQVNRKQLPEKVNDVALAFIRLAKDQQRSPEDLRARLEQLEVPLPLAQMGCEIYQAYQQALLYRGALDFDDLIRLALQALQLDEEYLQRLSHRWPYILEDEAQDSSKLQEAILNKLSSLHGNWVRVGDPNQAIFETFTTADPKFLREFLDLPDVTSLEMPNSGRSTTNIIDLANYLIEWTHESHPREEVRNALVPPVIELTPPGDPQPNPPDDPRGIRLVAHRLTPQKEIQFVADSLAEWLPAHPEETVAALVPRNQRGSELVDELRRRNIEYSDTLLGITTATRGTIDSLSKVLIYLSEPGSARKLAAAYQTWRRNDWNLKEYCDQFERVRKVINGCRQVEEYLWPRAGRDWLVSLALTDQDNFLYEELDQFRQIVQRWQGATALPIDQLIITLSQDMFTESVDIATAYKVAALMRRERDLHQDWQLPEFSEELNLIAHNRSRNRRRFFGFSEDDSGFDPKNYKGQVVVATMHKAKGLEWDRVYLMSVNNYDFPSGKQYDQYISEPWYLRDRLNLEAETNEQLQIAISPGDYDWYQEGKASRRERLKYVAERLRLLYVGITRAKRELVITWNSGRDGELIPAIPFQELMRYWEELHVDLGEVHE